MKALIFSIAICLSGTTFLSAQGVITKPELVGRIQQSGTKLVITVDNMATVNPNNGSGKAHSSSAKLNLGGQEQTILVPELKPETQFKKEIPIPTSLLNKSFVGTLKVDAGGVVVESNENNNVFTDTFNECDLSPVSTASGLVLTQSSSKGVYQIKVRNNGQRRAVASVTRVVVAKDNIALQVFNLPTPEIAPGATVSLSFTYTATLCHHTVHATSDQNGAVAESNESNNSSKITIPCED